MKNLYKKTYQYDGTNAGMLCTLADAIKRGEMPTFQTANSVTLNFAEHTHIVDTDEERSEVFLDWLKEISDEYSVRMLIYILMSDCIGYEDTLLKYCLLLRKHENNTMRMQANPIVRSIHDRCYKVTKEIHRFKGLIRFQELESGKYWAPFEPDNNIIVALIPHFTARFADQKWILHDISRQIIVTWDKQILYNKKAADYMKDEKISDAEKDIQQLWQTFYKSITITNRINPKLQAQFMPRRYWKYLPEVE
ncbi:MAG: TIGR03915 family putative DNA repair protein [Kiritimatiellae bacterium]|jgi:probable DNA metabolism protein|nr:TIGR03915 family putative DNA repair protein [Kiritimatiellia bacterium]